MNDQQLSRHIHLIYSAASNPENWQECLEDIALSINAKSGMLGMDDSETGHHIAALRVGHSPDALASIAENKTKDIWTKAALSKDIQIFHHNLELVPQKAYYSSEIYADCTRHLDIHYTAGAILNKDPSGVAFRIAFQRGLSQESYSSREIDYLNTLLPHFTQALTIGKKIHHQHISITTENLKSNEPATFIVDSLGKLAYYNQAAEGYLKSASVIHVQGGYIKNILGLSKTQLAVTLKSVTRNPQLCAPTPQFSYTIPGNPKNQHKRWLVDIFRYQAQESGNIYNAHLKLGSYAAIQVKPILPNTSLQASRLKSVYNLSDTEIDIANKLGQGLCPKEISKIRGRSVETTRKQIKNIQLKMGKNSTPEIVSEILLFSS